MSVFADKLNEKQKFVNDAIKGLDYDLHDVLEVPLRLSVSMGGKRLRPIICMLCAEILGGDYRSTRDAFIAIELIHSGSLVHDDIIDDDLLRRGSPSIHAEFGRKRAVLTGDALLSLGLQYATQTGKLSIVRRLSETALKMVQGAALQTLYRRKITSEETYLNIAYLKSGSLFEAAAALGALSYLDDEREVDDLSSFGSNFGMAYQIRDDICDLISKSEATTRSDILNGDPSLPFIYAMESNNISDVDRKGIMELYLGDAGEIDIGKLHTVLEESGALDMSVKKMVEYSEMGKNNLKRFKGSEPSNCINYLMDQYFRDIDPRDWKDFSI